jgi:hypothetical protein
MSWTAQPYRPVAICDRSLFVEKCALVQSGNIASDLGNHPTKWCSIVTSDTGGILPMLTDDVPIEDIEDGHFHGFFYCF